MCSHRWAGQLAWSRPHSTLAESRSDTRYEVHKVYEPTQALQGKGAWSIAFAYTGASTQIAIAAWKAIVRSLEACPLSSVLINGKVAGYSEPTLGGRQWVMTTCKRVSAVSLNPLTTFSIIVWEHTLTYRQPRDGRETSKRQGACIPRLWY